MKTLDITGHQFNQDLHIHSTFSKCDSAVVPYQTIDFIAQVKHSKIVGISDHFECFENNEEFVQYEETIRKNGLIKGIEVDGKNSVEPAVNIGFDYYIYHCYDFDEDYEALEILLNTEKPVIIAHPHALNTDLSRIPVECFIEINNRYIFRVDWREYYGPYTKRFRFVLSSDAHQPNWLNQNIARFAAKDLGIQETIIFD